MRRKPGTDYEQDFLTCHTSFGGTRKDAVHCYYCDHECYVQAYRCCDCGEYFDHWDVVCHPLRSRLEYAAAAEEEDNGAEFRWFPCLPYELRRQIWKLALPSPRVVLLQAYVTASEKDDQLNPTLPSESGPLASPKAFRCDTNPAVIYACHESREVASETYSYAFGTEAWFNFKDDTLYLDFGRPYGIDYDLKDLGDDLARVENLALFYPNFFLADDPTELAVYVQNKLMPRFKNLKRLSFVLKRHGRRETTDLIFEPKMYDFEQCTEYYAKPYDPSLSRAYFDQRPYPELADDIRHLLKVVASQPKESTLMFPTVSAGIIIRREKKEFRERAFNSWMMQRMSHSSSQEYRLKVYLNKEAPSAWPDSGGYEGLAQVNFKVIPETPLSIIESRMREIWHVPETVGMRFVCAGVFTIEPLSILGHHEHLIPQARGEDEVVRFSQGIFWHNEIRVTLTDRKIPSQTQTQTQQPKLPVSDYVLAEGFPGCRKPKKKRNTRG